MSIIIILLVVGLCGSLAQHDPNTVDNKQAIVQLFEWRWADIAAECERFLGPHGFGGVQVSPPSENAVKTNPYRPWWERYQPVSYLLITRSGNEDEFRDMVHRCNQKGVRIYVDLVINHMANGCGFGTGGSYYYDYGGEYESVPYGPFDFNCNSVTKKCRTSDCLIQNTSDPYELRNCRLSGLVDLTLDSEYVRGKVVDYMNHLVSIGVAGFRVDAAKHMWPEDLAAIFSLISDLNTAYFPPGSRPFIAMEIHDDGGPVSPAEYTHLGRYTDFRYGYKLGYALRKENDMTLKDLKNFGDGWDMQLDNATLTLVFVDNHDSQRGNSDGGRSILTFRDGRLYKMANAFMLAFPYGFVRLMSSFFWEQRWDNGTDFNDWNGPPTDSEANIMPVQINSLGTCDNGWICEHRWPQIRNMVKFRNVAAGHGLTNWWDNGNNQIAFSRGDRGFIAINNEDEGALEATLQTGLSPGDYCDVISGNHLSDGSCTGKTITVDGDGRARIYIAGDEEDPMIAIHAASKVGDESVVDPDTTTPVDPVDPVTDSGTSAPVDPVNPTLAPISPTEFERTIVFIKKKAPFGNNMFLRGGLNNRPGCTRNPDTSQCAIRIVHRTNTTDSTLKNWMQGDDHIDWYGIEDEQGFGAHGSPLVWTTNDVDNSATVRDQGYGYTPLNQWGPHYWMLDVNMDCSRTKDVDGWFELKAVLGFGCGRQKEGFFINQATCDGTAVTKPYRGANPNSHFAQCGKINVFEFDNATCTINDFAVPTVSSGQGFNIPPFALITLTFCLLIGSVFDGFPQWHE
ncbi:alpha-amylase-like [Branchiostoma lanceolatum]|uniref:alpha-amylase-like n=1 Tax=Branchiostoma lanceolatum TaxID=7740 RepID=UPI0034521BF0